MFSGFDLAVGLGLAALIIILVGVAMAAGMKKTIADGVAEGRRRAEED